MIVDSLGNYTEWNTYALPGFRQFLAHISMYVVLPLALR